VGPDPGVLKNKHSTHTVCGGGLLQTDPQERTQNPHCIFGLLVAPDPYYCRTYEKAVSGGGADPALTNMARARFERKHSKECKANGEDATSTLHIER